jgi:hypothetical protein
MAGGHLHIGQQTRSTSQAGSMLASMTLPTSATGTFVSTETSLLAPSGSSEQQILRM